VEESIDSRHEPLAKDYEKLSRNELRKQLAAFIRNLLVNNPERLAAMMYRHDVKEHLFQNALMLTDIEEQALFMADLVIDREMKKVESRKAYKKTRLK
jgi:hypothetical protein